MTIQKNRYFIGCIPPSPWSEKIDQLKNYFKDNYASKAALRSPPHITFHMPFDWRADKERELIASLGIFSRAQSRLEIQFDNFGCFSERVIFIRVSPDPSLLKLQYLLRKYCKTRLGLLNADYKDLPFHPHLTVAFRDLKKNMFVNAWQEFKEKEFQGNFILDRLTLLKDVDEKWIKLEELMLTGDQG